jgi:hypothetical protein
MALETIITPIDQKTAIAFIDKLDQRGEVYSFQAHIITPNNVALELNRDGNDDPLRLMLNADGTWTAQHEIVVGERT